MKNKNNCLICACYAAILFLTPGCFAATTPATSDTRILWLLSTDPKIGGELYMEISLDGETLTRKESPRNTVVKQGKIPAGLARDLCREADSSDYINSQIFKASKTIFYKGEVVKLIAYTGGEWRKIEAPPKSFGKAFEHAYKQVKKAAEKLKPVKTARFFLTAEQLQGAELEDFQDKATRSGELRELESSELKEVPLLMQALKQPYRLISLNPETDLKNLNSFVSVKRLYGMKTLFYLPSSRGVFKCRIIEDKAAESSVLPKR